VRNPLLLALAVALVACAGPVEPGSPDLSVGLESNLLEFTVDRTEPARTAWLRFTVPAVLHNLSDQPLSFWICSISLEYQVGSGWQKVWKPLCALTVGSTDPIPPGSSRALAVLVYAALEGPGAPEWLAAGTEGSFRLRIAASPYEPGQTTASSRARYETSPAFSLKPRE
jgi:hypothetical protein